MQTIPSSANQSLRRRPWVLALLLTAIAASPVRAADAPATGQWIPLFNGKNLDGWTPKIKGFELGDNHLDTFRVENGVIRVAYDKYTKFDEKFGHYRLRAEYRFIGEQTPGGPGWALRNSGLMLHCQAPETMRKAQDFPVSIEVQLLGGDGRAERSTANLCTPGTHVVLKGKLHTAHCTDSNSKTFHGDQWVTAEIEVHGDKVIKHFVNGEPVLEYEQAQLDPGDADAKRMIEQRGGEKLLREGWISLQAESHPVEFRKVELLPLAP
jgi:hypothetical protein